MADRMLKECNDVTDFFENLTDYETDSEDEIDYSCIEVNRATSDPEASIIINNSSPEEQFSDLLRSSSKSSPAKKSTTRPTTRVLLLLLMLQTNLELHQILIVPSLLNQPLPCLVAAVKLSATNSLTLTV